MAGVPASALVACLLWFRGCAADAALLCRSSAPPPTRSTPPPPLPLQDKKLTLRSFAAYSDWAKSVHFADPAPSGAQEDFGATRRPKSLPNQFPTGAGEEGPCFGFFWPFCVRVGVLLW